MSEVKNKSEHQNNSATPVQAPKEASSLGETEYVDARASTFQFIQLQAAADDQGKGNRITQLQSKASQFTAFSRVAQLQAKRDSKISSTHPHIVQREENKTGLPDGLKSGMESISGLSLDDVKVYRNSDKPAQLQAYAYAQGTDIHLGPGQEKHLPHELGHVVQQKQGRVKATTQLKGKVSINDSKQLEKEADTMGAKAQNLSISTGATSEAGVAQRKGVETKVVQMFGGMTNVSEDANSAADEASHANNMANAMSGENGLAETDAINSAASSIAGNVIASLQSVKTMWEKGKDAWEKRDFISGAEAFLAGGDLVSNALALAADGGANLGFGAGKGIPVLSSAIGAFKSGMEIFKNYKSLEALREFEKGKKLSKEDQYILNKKVSSLQIDIASNSADLVLNVVSAVGDFFPAVKAGAAVAQAAKFAFEKGMEAWTSYKSEKEQQALNLAEDRVAGKGIDLATAKELSAKVDKAEPDSLKSSNGTLMDMVNMKFEIENVRSQIEKSTDDTAKGELKSKESTLTAMLNESITIYNVTMRNIGSAKITYSDVENLQKIHASVIMVYLNKKEEEKSWWERKRAALGGPLAPMKDKILAELNKKGALVDDKDIQELSKGQHATYLWKKTQDALNEVSKGKTYFTAKELDAEMKAILENYNVPKEQIDKIIRE
jgi:hypothetical protein